MKCKQMWRLDVAAVEEEEGMLIRHHYQEHLKKKKNVLTDQKRLGNEDVISTRYLQKKKMGGRDGEEEAWTDLEIELSKQGKCQLLLSHIFPI